MGLAWLLVPALGGYLLLTRAHQTRNRVLWKSGYPLIFDSAIAGVALAIVAHIVVLLVDCWLPTVGTVWAGLLPPVEHSRTLFLSLFLGWALPPILNRSYGAEDISRARLQAAEEVGDLVTLLLAESIEHQKLVEISLKNRKVYIGFAISVQPTGEADIEILPFWSGYRNNDTCELTLTNHYIPVIERCLPSVPAEVDGDCAPAPAKTEQLRNFRVVVPKSEIVSTRLFDVDMYDQFD